MLGTHTNVKPQFCIFGNANNWKSKIAKSSNRPGCRN